MPQRRLFQSPGPTPDVDLPGGEGDDNLMNQGFRGLMVALGLEGQKPGDAAGGIGALAGMLPLGKFLKFPSSPKVPSNVGDSLLREHTMPSEFHMMPDENPLAGLPREEIEKAIELTRRKPR